MRSWYTDIMAKPQSKNQIDWAELGRLTHDIISAAVGALLILLLAFILTGARVW